MLLSVGTSSIENKYETIEKSLSPYKIDPSESIKNNSGGGTSSPGKRVQVSIRKQLLQQHEQESNSKAKLQKVHQQLQQFATNESSSSNFPPPHPYLSPSSSRGAPREFAGLSSISPSFSSSSSSHYAQISPLRGVGRPAQQHNTPTYFQVSHPKMSVCSLKCQL